MRRHVLRILATPNMNGHRKPRRSRFLPLMLAPDNRNNNKLQRAAAINRRCQTAGADPGPAQTRCHLYFPTSRSRGAPSNVGRLCQHFCTLIIVLRARWTHLEIVTAVARWYPRNSSAGLANYMSKITVFIAAIVAFSSLNCVHRIQRALGFNRPMPAVDAFTMFWLVSGAVLLAAQGFFDFTLFDFMPETMGRLVYGLVGLCAVWHGSRQK